MQKKQLRKLYLEKRLNLSQKDLLKLDDLLLIQLQKMALDDVSVLLSYAPIESKNEPDTFLFARYLSVAHPGLQLAYPVSNFSDCSIKAVTVKEDTLFVENDYGIAEPGEGVEVDPKLIDVVFVPMIICDKYGRRVGYGKGFYDRFLPVCRKDVVTIGFSYFDPVDEISDIGSWDIPLQYCITPENIHRF